MSDQKEKRPKDKEEGLAAHIVGNQLQREAEKIEKELKKNKELEEVTAPDYMYDKIKDKIEEYEKDKRAEEYLRQIMEEDDEEEDDIGYDKAAVYALLSKEDREALKIGKEVQARKAENHNGKRKWRVLKKVAAFAIVLTGVFGISMISESNRAYILEKANHIVGGTLITKVNTKGDVIEDDEYYEEIKACEKVKKKVGIKVLQFNYKPPGLVFDKSDISSMGFACLFYKYKGQVISVTMDKAQSSQASCSISSADRVSRVKINDFGLDVDIYRLEDDDVKLKTYKADIIYLNTYYSIMGRMELKEFKKMLKEVIFI